MGLIREIFKKAKDEGRRVLTEFESKGVIREYGIPTTVGMLATTSDEAVRIASEIGFPVALKISSPEITHKTNVEGVRLGVKNTEEVRDTFNEVIANVKKHKPNIKIQGVLVQNMAVQGVEVIVGSIRDPQFGSVIMFGLGGVFVEFLKDVSFRLPPITRKEALEMISEVRGYALLQGVRGAKPADIDAVADILEKTSKMVVELPEIFEMEMNPIFVYEKGALAVDARIVLQTS